MINLNIYKYLYNRANRRSGSGTITAVLSREIGKHGHQACAYFATDINKNAAIATAKTGDLNKVNVNFLIFELSFNLF